MKLYKFYKKPSKDALETSYDLSIEDKYPLYAFTNDKKIRDIFYEDRNIKKFIEIKTKITKDEYVDFVNRNNGCLLSENVFKHFNGYSSSKFSNENYDDIKIVSTWYEKEYTNDYIETYLLSDEIYDNGLIVFPFIFKEKYIKALGLIKYIDNWRMISPDHYLNKYLTEEETEEYIDNYDIYENIMFDEYNIFISLYNDTFK